ILLGPINVISQISYPISLSLRLFGNMLAAVIMLEIIALMPIYIGFIFNGVWKAFEGAFVDVVQAFIFALLTVIYLSLAAGDDEHHAAEAAPG
ncbi:MAG: F0F1 ATP synthase subunit A, partial [Terriglobales bacterium]